MVNGDMGSFPQRDGERVISSLRSEEKGKWDGERVHFVQRMGMGQRTDFTGTIGKGMGIPIELSIPDSKGIHPVQDLSYRTIVRIKELGRGSLSRLAH
jgi:hypothetical protein